MTTCVIPIIIISTMIFESGVPRLFELIAAITIKTTRLVEKKLKKFGLTYPQFGALFALSNREGLRQNELAGVLDIDTTTVMVICDGLEKKELLRRARDERDRRAYRLFPTESGKELLEAAVPEVTEVYLPIANMISGDEVEQIIPVLERMAVKVRAETESYQKRGGSK